MQFKQLKRRAFMTLLGGAAAWPIGARAQQGEQKRRIGVLNAVAADNPEEQARLAAFHQGLGELGWIVGRNVMIDIRWVAGDTERAKLRGGIGCACTGCHPGDVGTRPRSAARTAPRHGRRSH
jgi:hypothetical protein